MKKTIYSLSPCIIPEHITENGKSIPNPAYGPVSTLLSAIESEDIRNIAVTGNYGAGKSSVIDTAIAKRKELAGKDNKKGGSVNVSLALLNTMPGKAEASIKAKDIENSIVRQLLYCDSPKMTPKSRFHRLHKPDSWQLARIISTLIISVILSLVLFEPKALYVNSLARALSVNSSVKLWIDLAAVIGLIAIFIFTCIFIANNLHFPVRRVKISDTEVEIEKSPFNQHLDEIIYFFESTGYKVVTFEDLDRFDESTYIFYKLRELNQILNNCKHLISDGKITFIYAVRDNLFGNTDKVKFFDYIVSIVPIVNNSNSYDTVLGMLDKEDREELEGKSLMNLCEFFEDMRLLKSTINDYNQYKTIIDFNVLKRKKLFGMIVYKNLCPDDFTMMHNRHGIAASIIERKQSYLNEMREDIRNEIAENEKASEAARKEEKRKVREIKERFIEEYKSYAMDIDEDIDAFIVGGKYLTFKRALEWDTFKKYLSNPAVKFYSSTSRTTYTTIPDFSSIENGVNPDMTYLEQIESVSSSDAISEYKERINMLQKKLQTLPRKMLGIVRSMPDRITEDIKEEYSRLHISEAEKDHKKEIPENELAILKYLLLNDYIDENYLHYISYFYPGSLTVTDRNFIIEATSQIALNHTTPLNHVNSVIDRLDMSDFEDNPYILNTSLIRRLYEGQQYTPYREAILRNISANENLEFISSAYNGGLTNVPERFFKEIFRKWDPWNEIRNNETLDECEELTECYIRFSDIEKGEANNDFAKWLTGNFGFVADHIANISISRLGTLISRFGIKFEHINIHRRASKELASLVLGKLCFKLNTANLTSIMKYYGSDGKYKMGAYSAILQTENSNFISYIDSDLNNLINSVFPETSKSENSHAQTLLLNNGNVKDATVRQYLLRQNSRIRYAGEINASRLKFAFDNNLVEATWENIEHYIQQTGSELPMKFLENNLLPTVYQSSPSSSAHRILSLIQSNKLSIKAYENIVDTMEFEIDEVDENLSKERLEVLVRKRKLRFGTKSYACVHKKRLATPYILNNLTSYLSEAGTYMVGNSEVCAVMDTLKTQRKQSEYLKQISAINVYAGEDLADRICGLITKKQLKVTDINFITLRESISKCRKSDTKRSIGKKALLSRPYDKHECAQILEAMSGDYKRLLTDTTYSMIPRDRDNLDIVKHLAQNGFIKDFKETGSNIKVFKV